MNRYRQLSILLLILTVAINDAVYAATISCENHIKRESTKNDSTQSLLIQPTQNSDLEITCAASVDSGDASSLEVVLGNDSDIKVIFPCDELPHKIPSPTPSQALTLYPRALLFPEGALSGWFTVKHTNTGDVTNYNFTITDPRTAKNLLVDYVPSVNLEGSVSEKMTTPLITASNGNGSITLTPDLSGSASYGALSDGSHNLDYNLSNLPVWNNGAWALDVGTTYDMQLNNMNVPAGTYTGHATVTATCE